MSDPTPGGVGGGSTASPDASLDRDVRLATLLEELHAARRQGRAADIEAAVRQHPELAEELRALWAVAELAHWGSTSLPVTSGRRAQSSGEPDSELPRDFGDYVLLRELGRGGMGVVYQARQKSLNRLVALKMIRESRLTDPAEQARFRIEAEAVARLQHPHIVTVHEVGTCDGHAYLCMEYLEGPTLAEVVRQQGPLPPRLAARIVAQVARAVHHAHQHGILHRDLKPSNIILAGPLPSADTPAADRCLAKVTDFGLAKRLDADGSLTRSGAVVGTPSYMAPEQAAGRRELTPAADVYALGAILYELLTGRPPFQAAHPVDTLLLVLEQEPVPPRDLNPTVDRELELICLKCLQKPVELRYASAAALAEDLEAYVAGEPTRAAPSGLRYVISRFFRETHHADVLENWGRLWMWHSLMIFLLCLTTQSMAWSGWHDHVWYLGLWSVGLITWATVLWQLRKAAGPVLFVERQIAHAWAAGVCASIAMFAIEWLGGLPPLTLSPAVAVAAGMIMIVKAGILSGRFYIWAALNFAAAIIMTLLPQISVLLFGVVSALSFFVPGWKYYRQRRDRQRQRPRV